MNILRNSGNDKGRRKYPGPRYCGPIAKSVRISDNDLFVELSDGRIFSLSYSKYPRLENATDFQRRNFRLLGNGIGIHWPDIDEDLSTEGIVKEGRLCN